LTVAETQDHGRLGRTWKFWIAMVLLPGALAVLIALGTWQVQRLYWKEALLAAIEQRSTAPPVDLQVIEESLAAGRADRIPGSFRFRSFPQ
jgi:surfeit locus 1 family protein